MANEDYNRFKTLTFERFQQLARDASLSPYEKIGFPNSYREGKETDIVRDIQQKLRNLHEPNQVILDIGPGCSDVPRMIIDSCLSQGSTLLLVDSAEMLNLLPDAPGIIKVPGRFPDDCMALIDQYRGRVNALLTYSVCHYVFHESNVFHFLDSCLHMLAVGGEILIGDIPNISKRKRFFGSPTGIRHHQQFTGTQEIPAVVFNQLERGEIDDSVILSLLLRARTAGFDAYVVPQAQGLPMENRDRKSTRLNSSH